jgi:hypothetical protein
MLDEKGEYVMAKFTKRPREQGISYSQTYVPGKLDFPIEPIEKSKIVTLHYEDHLVLVKNISRKADGTFTGTVLGFEPPAMKLGDLKIDDSVTFKEDEVFSAIKED